MISLKIPLKSTKLAQILTIQAGSRSRSRSNRPSLEIWSKSTKLGSDFGDSSTTEVSEEEFKIEEPKIEEPKVVEGLTEARKKPKNLSFEKDQFALMKEEALFIPIDCKGYKIMNKENTPLIYLKAMPK